MTTIQSNQSSEFLGIHHHSIVIADVEVSRQFYQQIVGLQLDESRPDMAFDGLWFDVGDQAIHCLCLPNPDPVQDRPQHGGRDRHVALSVYDIEPLIDRLSQNSINFTRSKSGRPAIFFRDPDGNAIEVIECLQISDMKNDLFHTKAERYEQDDQRVANVVNIANTIVDRIPLNPQMRIMDFGSGTGLLLENIAPYVKSITAVDISPSMNEQLQQKRGNLDCELELIEMDFTQETLDRKFDGIISSMTLHHIKDVPAMFQKFHLMLKKDGFIAIADLATEDGSFHEENTGVYHLGFDLQELTEAANLAGFKKINAEFIGAVQKPDRDYSVLLLTGFAQ